jgi:dihydropteroate synthase
VTAPKEPAGLPSGMAQLGRTTVMAVLNVTPDSFSDGGRYTDVATAVKHGIAEHAAGADIVDVGGESTRPGAERVPADEEERRVLPVVRALVAEGVPVSIDTMRTSTAVAALEAGACLVNDVSGGLADDTMLATIGPLRVPYVAMHWRGPSAQMHELAVYDDVVRDVRRELRSRLEAAVSAGLDPAYVVLDPGLGFAKTGDHNWALLGHLGVLAELGRPLLIGASRKRFLGDLLAVDGEPRAMDGRDPATDAVSALAARAGVWCVRVHDVRGTVDAVKVAAAWREGRGR